MLIRFVIRFVLKRAIPGVSADVEAFGLGGCREDEETCPASAFAGVVFGEPGRILQVGG